MSHIEVPNEQIQNQIFNAKNFEELIQTIKDLNNVQGSEISFSSEEMIQRIYLVRNGSQHINIITRTFGIRDKVSQLINAQITMPTIKSFESLYTLIKNLGYVPTSNGIMQPEQVINEIKYAVENKLTSNFITRTFGIRDKVEELLENQKNNPVDEFHKALLQSENSFIQAYFPEEDILSGWKLHIYGENVDDSYELYSILKDYLMKNHMGFKLATATFFRNVNLNNKQFGKAMTIYIPIKLFHERNIIPVLHKIETLLKRARYTKDGNISGDKKFSTSIYYRYELNIPMPFSGANRELYNAHYRNNDGNHNIPLNPDLIESWNR